MSQREDLLAAAKKLLVDKGYHRTTARDIATASGSHLASIGYHYGSKDALMTAAALEAQGEWGHAIDEALAAAGAASPSDRLRIAVDELVAALKTQREILVAGVQTYALAAYDSEVHGVMTAATADARTTLAAGVLGVDVDAVDAKTTRGMGSVVHSLIAGLSFQALLDPASLPTGEQVVEALRTLAAGR